MLKHFPLKKTLKREPSGQGWISRQDKPQGTDLGQDPFRGQHDFWGPEQRSSRFIQKKRSSNYQTLN